MAKKAEQIYEEIARRTGGNTNILEMLWAMYHVVVVTFKEHQ